MSMRDYGPAAPHGPNMDVTQHTATQALSDMSPNEATVFQSILKPDDSYDETGTYWGDMNLFRRAKFTTGVDGQESRRELSNIWKSTKQDPLAPVGFYLKNMVLPGAGLLLEGYVLFSIGNIKPLLEASFPACWKQHQICNKTWIQSLEYLEVVGIILGQILVGILGDWMGRRWGLLQDAIIMFLGLLMLTASWGVTQNGWVICYTWSLFFYGIGVGGEYPMTATSGMENAVGSGKVSTRDDRLHRGRKVTSAFLMQGWGQFFNQVLLIFLLLIFHHGSGNPPYSEVAAQWTYRVSFAIPAVGTLWLVYYRYFKMASAGKQLALAKKKSSVTGYDTESLKLTFSYFGFRVLGTAGSWYCNDIFFYGNKLFQSQFIKLLTSSDSVMVNWLYNLLNVGVALVGYYMASFFIDNKLYGRKWMMIIGYLLDFILFAIPAFNYNYYAGSNAPVTHVHAFQAMYFLSTFFNQFGPNSVTFIVAAEVYPTPIRATAHGLSAAVGKMGALTAAVLYNYITVKQIFLVVPWFGLAGAILTFCFIPDTTGLDLKESERRWACIREGREEDYHGVAVHPKHLSLYERLVTRKGRFYDPDLDYRQRLDDLRGEWETAQAERAEKEEGADDDDWSEHVHSYFSRNAGSYRNGFAVEKKVSEEDTL